DVARPRGHGSLGNSFSFVRRFTEEMDQLFNDFGVGGGLFGSSAGRDLFPASWSEFGRNIWSPQVEVFEREGQLVVRADLPGLTKDDVQVELNDNSITITGERHNQNEEEHEGYYHSERSYGRFARTIRLPEGVN